MFSIDLHTARTQPSAWLRATLRSVLDPEKNKWKMRCCRVKSDPGKLLLMTENLEKHISRVCFVLSILIFKPQSNIY